MQDVDYIIIMIDTCEMWSGGFKGCF